jgi:hypothetical protein
MILRRWRGGAGSLNEDLAFRGAFVTQLEHAWVRESQTATSSTLLLPLTIFRRTNGTSSSGVAIAVE